MELTRFLQDFMDLIGKRWNERAEDRRYDFERLLLSCIYPDLQQTPRCALFSMAKNVFFIPWNRQIALKFQDHGKLPNGTNIAFFEGRSSH
jgi:hypothetical protein